MTPLLATAGILLGGLGLLLVGMGLMTDGFKMAAGSALRDILAKWTSDRRRGLLSGFLITAVVQSSSAVTVATIGFANANLLSLRRAVWVIFGSNVGTTMTAWIVALIGLKIDVEAFALPLVGAGVILRLAAAHGRLGSLGQAVVGFGLLFLGIGVLKMGFESFGQQLVVPTVAGTGILSVAGYVVAGTLMTTAMQSSSAALVVALSAAQGGLIALPAAAAVVIGANLGTTTTALMTVWEATPTAKRVAVSHVLFNVVTAIVAIVILAPILDAVEWVQNAGKLSSSPAMTLAVFHTTFNLLGVLLMWPLADPMVRHLSRRFQSLEEVESRPRFLDRTSLDLPFIAGEAMANEVERIHALAVSAALAATSAEHGDASALDEDAQVAHSLEAAIADYSAALSESRLPPTVSDVLPDLLRSAQQSGTVIGLAQQAMTAQAQIGAIREEQLAASRLEFREQLLHLIEAADAACRERDPEKLEPAKLEQGVHELDHRYATLKRLSLRDCANGRISVMQMDALLEHASLARRTVKQLARATRRLTTARAALGSGSSADDSATLEAEQAAEPAAVETEED